LGTAFVALRSDTEAAVGEIWADMLGIDRVGVHDNFFELGGDSLMGTQLLSRLRLAFHVQLSLQSLFETPTIAALAAVIDGEEGEEEMDRMAALLQEIEGMSEDEAEESLEETS
jgi:acyl carrier protein